MNKYDKREKAALAIMTEYNELGELQKKNRYYEPLEVPIFRGYNISLKLRDDVARSERGERFMRVWQLIAPKPQLIRASIWNKAKNFIYPLSSAQMLSGGYTNDYFNMRTHYKDHPLELRPRRKKQTFVDIYIGLHGITEKQWLELTPDLQKLFYKLADWEQHMFSARVSKRIYQPSLQAFELSFKVDKYFQTEILVEDSRIDSREKELSIYLWDRDMRWLELPDVDCGKDRWGNKGANHHKYRYYANKEKRMRHHGYMRHAAKLAKLDLIEEAKEEDWPLSSRQVFKFDINKFYERLQKSKSYPAR